MTVEQTWEQTLEKKQFNLTLFCLGHRLGRRKVFGVEQRYLDCCTYLIVIKDSTMHEQ